jgi:hypothetical protein
LIRGISILADDLQNIGWEADTTISEDRLEADATSC